MAYHWFTTYSCTEKPIYAGTSSSTTNEIFWFSSCCWPLQYIHQVHIYLTFLLYNFTISLRSFTWVVLMCSNVIILILFPAISLILFHSFMELLSRWNSSKTGHKHFFRVWILLRFVWPSLLKNILKAIISRYGSHNFEID